MSSALGIAAVTAVLKNLLDNRLIEQGVAASLGDVSVSALPPDRIPTGTDERSQLNLFLYRITPNSKWRAAPANGATLARTALESDHTASTKDSSRGAAPRGAAPRASTHADSADSPTPPDVPPRPPLALDLHYLLTAYGEQDLQAEILLGYGIETLHSAATLHREAIRNALAAITSTGSTAVIPPARAALAATQLGDSVAAIDIAPEFLSTEEVSRLWSTLQARYRPSAAYKVSTVLIGSGA